MIAHDKLFKELLTAFFFEFIELFLPQMAEYLDNSSVVFIDKELFTDSESLEADLVVKVKFRGSDSFFIIHVESQAQPQADFGFRLFNYFTLLHKRHNLPVYPIVLFSFDSPRTTQPCVYELRFPDWHVLSFRYRAVQLNRLNWRRYLKQDNPVAAALMAKMQVAIKDRDRVKLECLRMIVRLRLDRDKSRLISALVDTYLELTAAEQRKFDRKYKKLDIRQQEEIMEIVTSWMKDGIKKGRQEGLQEGLQKGRQEGRLECGISLVTRLLTRRLGSFDLTLQAQIRSLNLNQIEQLGEALLDFRSVNELHQWLASVSQPGLDDV